MDAWSRLIWRLLLHRRRSARRPVWGLVVAGERAVEAFKARKDAYWELLC